MKKNIFEQKTLIIVSFLFFNIILMSTNIVLKDNRTVLEYSIGTVISPIQIFITNSIEYIKSKWENYFFLKNIYQRYKKSNKLIFELKKENYLLNSKIKYLENQLMIDKIKNNHFKVVTQTRVISIDRNYMYNNIIINSGSLDKIKPNMVVLNRHLELVGVVTNSITPLSSTVRLITSKRGGVGAYISNEEMEGFLTGNNNKICLFKYLIESKPIKTGNTVVTSGTDGIFPENIQIGEVISIKKEYLEQEIKVKPFFLNRPINELIVIERLK